MYAYSKNMSQQCFRALSFLENIKQTKYALILSRFRFGKSNTWQNFSITHKVNEVKLFAAVKLVDALQQRNASSSSGDGGKKEKPSALMSFQPVIRPEVFLTLKNWILAKFIIQPYLDRDFSLRDFTIGAKQALENVSSFLSQGDVNSLKELVSDDAIAEIKRNLSSFNVKERQDLLIKVKDILFAFPYQIGIIFDDANQKRFAEITVVYHCLDGFGELKAEGKMIPETLQQDIKICNYRFIREYTKGIESDWIINRLGHFRVHHFEKL